MATRTKKSTPELNSGITTEQAYEMGAKGAPATEGERQLFEAWMRGHCWALEGDWDGTTYVHHIEKANRPRSVHPGAMLTRCLWAAWRDRAALCALSTTSSFNGIGNLCEIDKPQT